MKKELCLFGLTLLAATSSAQTTWGTSLNNDASAPKFGQHRSFPWLLHEQSPATDPQQGNCDGGGCVSVYPKWGQYDNDIYPQSKWEYQFFEKQLEGHAADGVNGSLIDPQDEFFTTVVHNVNKKMWTRLSSNLDKGRNLLNTGRLVYGAGYGCVNNTSRALLYSGVINVNAFLPITSPLFLNFELEFRSLMMLNSPYLIKNFK